MELQHDRPSVLKNIDWTRLIQVCEERINELELDPSDDSDTPHYIYEEAMQAVYGNDVFDWINERT